LRDSLGKTRADRTHRAHNARMPATDRHAATSQQNSATGTLRIVIHGANGRMGQRIAACVPADGACHAVRCIDREDEHGLRAGDADAVIDFSSDEGARAAIGLATSLGIPLVTGTTGLSEAASEAIAAAAKKIAVLPC